MNKKQILSSSYKSKWVRQIVDLQHENGSWGNFHSLAIPNKSQPLTTEQAIRRLQILGLTKEEEPIERAINYMEKNLNQPFPTVFHEKKHDSKTYGDLMLAAWIRRYDTKNKAALVIANKWAEIISYAFDKGAYSHENYISAFEAEFVKLNPKANCLVNFVVFYQLSLLPGLLEHRVEEAMLNHVLSHNQGIMYIYDKPVNTLPERFASLRANRYLAAVELLAAYDSAPGKLEFVAEWLLKHRDDDGMWDMSAEAKDGIYFPLSDSWRKKEERKHDCTIRVKRLLRILGENIV